MNWKPLLLTAAALSGLLAALNPAFAQGTAFTYQGRLNDAGLPANGLFDLRAALFTGSSGGGAFAGPITNSAVVVSNGLFAATLDFGPHEWQRRIYSPESAPATDALAVFHVCEQCQQSERRGFLQPVTARYSNKQRHRGELNRVVLRQRHGFIESECCDA